MSNILIACEESQAVCIEFRKLGHNAFSCDIQDCSGGHPEWHIQHDVIPLLNGNCKFSTSDGAEHEIKGKWDLIIAHPPCTHLAVSGARWFKEKQRDGRQQAAIIFFMKMIEADCNMIAVENPVSIMSTKYRKPDQIIQPYMFGDRHRKATCLWLKNLPSLTSTNIVKPDIITYKSKNGKYKTSDIDFAKWYHSDSDRSKKRSKTYPGIAKAMAEQWGHLLNEEQENETN